MIYSENYNFYLAEDDDFVDFENLNNNFEIIDDLTTINSSSKNTVCQYTYGTSSPSSINNCVYRKYSDGICELYGVISNPNIVCTTKVQGHEVDVYSTAQSLLGSFKMEWYRSDLITITFPSNAFVSVDNVMLNVGARLTQTSSIKYYPLSIHNVTNPSSSTQKIECYLSNMESDNLDSVNRQIYFMVKGRS